MNFELCELCRHYNFNLQEGILCGLTNGKPDFVETCPNHIPDPRREQKVRLVYQGEKPRRIKTGIHELPEMEGALRRWGIGLIILGIIHLLAYNMLSPVWGVMIIILGILNLAVTKREMFIINGAFLLFIGLLNLLNSTGFGGSLFWLIFGLLQLFWGGKEISKYQKYGGKEKSAGQTNSVPAETASVLPAMAARHSALGIISVILFGAIFLTEFMFFVYISIKSGANPSYFEQNPDRATLVGVILFSNILFCLVGAILGLVDLFQKSKKKLFPILGIVLNSLFFIFHIMNMFLSAGAD